MSSLCTLCLEVDISDPASPGIVLSDCNHQCCRSCLARWITSEESTGCASQPTCPFCRLPLHSRDVLAVLERPFCRLPLNSPAVACTTPGEDSIDDELTRQWVNENTKLCRRCGSRIEKTDGCDNIECLCGFRFCYTCLSPRAECDCSPWDEFEDDDEYDYISDDPIRDAGGRVDIKLCLLRKKVRRERDHRSFEKDEEEDEFWSEDGGLGIVWLFLPNDQGPRLIASAFSSEGAQRRRDTRYSRKLARYEVTREKTVVEAAIQSGAWMFGRFKTPEDSLRCLEKLWWLANNNFSPHLRC